MTIREMFEVFDFNKFGKEYDLICFYEGSELVEEFGSLEIKDIENYIEKNGNAIIKKWCFDYVDIDADYAVLDVYI